MKTVTVTELRYKFRVVGALLRDGNEVVLTKRGKPIARIASVLNPTVQKFMKPDFMAQLKEILGDRIFSAKEIAEMRTT